MHSILAAALVVFACFNATQAEVDANVKKVKAAEAALQADDTPKALRLIAGVASFLALASYGPGDLHAPQFTSPDPSLLRRARRVDALATSRSGRRLEDALRTFEKEILPGVGDPDPTLLADYAEVASRVPARAPQATMMLRSLAEKDLLGSAHAYEALARLEKTAGDAPAEQRAREKCRTMTKKPRICG